MSFSDGRALCYLLHHYHPELITLDAIRTATTLTYNGDADLSVASSSDDSYDNSGVQPSGLGTDAVYELYDFYVVPKASLLYLRIENGQMNYIY